MILLIHRFTKDPLTLIPSLVSYGILLDTLELLGRKRNSPLSMSVIEAKDLIQENLNVIKRSKIPFRAGYLSEKN